MKSIPRMFLYLKRGFIIILYSYLKLLRYFRVDFNFARSSGPGGQNVNKVNTKAELRLNVMEADWIEIDIRRRILEYQKNKISNEGILCLSSQEHR